MARTVISAKCRAEPAERFVSRSDPPTFLTAATFLTIPEFLTIMTKPHSPADWLKVTHKGGAGEKLELVRSLVAGTM